MTLEARAEMLIRRPVADVFAAFIDPAITSRFALVLAGLKALLEHGVTLNLVGDRLPKAAA